MRTLNVWLEASTSPIGQLVGSDDGEIYFAYSAQWLIQPENHPLSLSLPLIDRPFGDALSRAFFGNLLQENDQLERVMAREGLDRGDIVGLLAYVGADCAGAVSILPTDHPPIKRPGDLTSDYDALDENSFRDIIQRLATGRPLPTEMPDPSPVAGFRRKISLAALPGDQFGLPKSGSGAPTTHILKIPDPDHRQEARHEAFVTLLAAQCGLSVGRCISDTVDDQEILLIRRFDRILEGQSVFRIHQEDFAQAAGLPSELKYERRGREGRRFDARTIGQILAATDQPARVRDQFLRATLFNLLIGNNDNHAKNYALLHLPGQATSLAPFYDLVPVQMVAGFNDELAFRIGEARRAQEIRKADMLHFCQAIGVSQQGAPRVLDKASRDIIETLEPLTADLPADMRALDRLVGEVAMHLNEALGLGIQLRERDAHIVQGGGWNFN